MTVYIEKPAVNLREELASLRNQGGYEEQQFYFDGLVTNGTFDTDTNWTKGTGWTISGGVASASSALNSSLIQSPFTTTAGMTYAITYTISGYTSGAIRPLLEGTIGTYRSANGTFTDYIVSPSSSARLIFTTSGSTTLNIDNISVFETDGTDVVHRMPKGWVPLHVYEDGLLQREGAANDYEVVYDGFDYYVKPAVAPSATTQTCVIGVRK